MHLPTTRLEPIMSSSSANARLAADRRLLRAPAVPVSLNWPRALGTRFAPLVQAAHLDDLLMLVVRFAEEIAQAGGGFVALVEPRTHEVDLSSARDARGLTVRPADLHSLFAGEGVLPRLGHGVHVQQTSPSGAITLLLPLVHDSRLQAILGVDLPGPVRPLGRAVEPLRDLCQQSAPLVARLREIADLQALVAGLTSLVQDGAQHEARLREVEEDRRGARYEVALKTHLIASVNHALRTPLVSLRGYARLLLDENVTPEQQRQYIGVLARNAERLVEVAANLLGAPRVRPSLAPTDARACWSAALAETRTAAAARGVTLVEHVPEAPVSLVADETLLRRMLTELLAGTLEVTPRGEELRAEMLVESRRIVVTITAGRDAEPAPAETGRRAESPGRSLRLDTVRELANLHGGGFVVLRENARQRAYSVVLPRVSLEE
jgi:signal transduction histidine kinase